MNRFALALLFAAYATPLFAQQLANKRSFSGGGEEAGAIAFSPDSRRLHAFFPWVGLQTVDPNSAEAIDQTTLPKGSYPWAMAVSPDGKTLAVAHINSGELTAGDKQSEDLSIGVYDTATRKLLTTLQDEIGTVRAITFLPDNQTIITCGQDRTLRWWDTAMGDVLASRKTAGYFFDFDPQSGLLAVSAGEEGVEIWDANERRLVKRLDAHADFKAIALAPGGRQVAVSMRKGDIHLHDTATGELTTTLRGGPADYCQCLAFSPNGHLLAECTLNGDIALWDTRTSKVLSRQRSGVSDSLCFSPDGKVLAQVYGISDASNGVMLWDVVEE